jgi:hypothetical protein
MWLLFLLACIRQVSNRALSIMTPDSEKAAEFALPGAKLVTNLNPFLLVIIIGGIRLSSTRSPCISTHPQLGLLAGLPGGAEKFVVGLNYGDAESSR